MPTVVTFWRLPAEEGELLRFLEKDGRVVALPLESATPGEGDDPWSPSQLIARGDPPKIFLTLRSQLALVQYVQYEKDGNTAYGIDATNSPVIMYSRSGFSSPGKLGQSNVSAYMQKLTADKSSTRLQEKEFTS